MKIQKPKFWDKSKISFFSIILLPFSILYQIFFYFKKKITRQNNFPIPIICVGNIYLGGTGKTPLAIQISNILSELKMKPVVIKKKYINQIDEQLLLKKYCDLIISKKRAEGISSALDKNFNIIILDDGYQDFSIEKNISIICFNSIQKIGNGLTIPSGPLRENLSSLKNCDLVFINGDKDLVFEEKLKKYNSNLNFFYCKYDIENITKFSNEKVIAFAGIGNPSNFFNLLKNSKINVIKEINYPDHYSYKSKDLDSLIEQKDKFGAKLITTEKDFMRIKSNYRNSFDYIPIKLKIDNQDDFKKFLKKNIL